jgi:DNA-directed RNA polymerase delta subunit
MTDDIRDVILSAVEASLDAQLRAVRRLRQGQREDTQAPRKQGRSQVDMAYDILKKARTPLHVSEIIDRIQTQFGVTIDRESLVSSLSKKVTRQDRFLRPEKNTFSLRSENR